MCKGSGESIAHLLIYSPLARDLRSGFCVMELWIYYLVDKVELAGPGMWSFGMRFLIAYSGVFGGRGMLGVPRGKNS
jgi:hypothetical protein